MVKLPLFQQMELSDLKESKDFRFEIAFNTILVFKAFFDQSGVCSYDVFVST